MVDRVLGLSLTALFLFTHMGTQRKCVNKTDGDRHVGEEKSFLLDCADSYREIVYNCAKNLNFIKIW